MVLSLIITSLLSGRIGVLGNNTSRVDMVMIVNDSQRFISQFYK
jgi:hypothetical protein